MEPYLTKLENDRKTLSEQISTLNATQLNLFPDGHSNNIIWNLGHLLAVSENILYRLLPAHKPVHPFDIAQFGRNTSPVHFIYQTEISLVIAALKETTAHFRKTAQSKAALDIEVSLAAQLVAEDRLQFLLFHERMHYQTIQDLCQLVRKI